MLEDLRAWAVDQYLGEEMLLDMSFEEISEHFRKAEVNMIKKSGGKAKWNRLSDIKKQHFTLPHQSWWTPGSFLKFPRSPSPFLPHSCPIPASFLICVNMGMRKCATSKYGNSWSPLVYCFQGSRHTSKYGNVHILNEK